MDSEYMDPVRAVVEKYSRLAVKVTLSLSPVCNRV